MATLKAALAAALLLLAGCARHGADPAWHVPGQVDGYGLDQVVRSGELWVIAQRGGSDRRLGNDDWSCLLRVTSADLSDGEQSGTQQSVSVPRRRAPGFLSVTCRGPVSIEAHA